MLAEYIKYFQAIVMRLYGILWADQAVDHDRVANEVVHIVRFELRNIYDAFQISRPFWST